VERISVSDDETDHFVALGGTAFVLPGHGIPKGGGRDDLQREVERDVSHVRHDDHVAVALLLPHLEQVQHDARRLLEDERVVPLAEGRGRDFAVAAPLVVLRRDYVPAEEGERLVDLEWFWEAGAIHHHFLTVGGWVSGTRMESERIWVTLIASGSASTRAGSVVGHKVTTEMMSRPASSNAWRVSGRHRCHGAGEETYPRTCSNTRKSRCR
jgi:hypothetical protein